MVSSFVWHDWRAVLILSKFSVIKKSACFAQLLAFVIKFGYPTENFETSCKVPQKTFGTKNFFLKHYPVLCACVESNLRSNILNHASSTTKNVQKLTSWFCFKVSFCNGLGSHEKELPPFLYYRHTVAKIGKQ